MKLWTFEVTETLAVRKQYVVEAETEEEAEELAESGNTESETEMYVEGVVGRVVIRRVDDNES